MRVITRFLVPAVAALVVAAVIGSPAAAQSSDITDQPGDVLWVFGLKSRDTDVIREAAHRPESSLWTADGALGSGVDTRSLRVKHGKKSISIGLHAGSVFYASWLSMRAEIRVSASKTYSFVNTSSKSARIENSSGKKICSAHYEVKVGKIGTAYALIPRKCLGYPKQIKVSVASFRMGKDDDGTYAALIDMINPDYLVKPATTKWLKSS
jgi:hypothetical protein